MEKSPQNVGQAIEQAKKERLEAKGPDALNQVVASQIADALIGIRWALVGIMAELKKG
jgi:hypothetical protein